jgi:hypothetical protein
VAGAIAGVAMIVAEAVVRIKVTAVATAAGTVITARRLRDARS